MTQQPPLPPPPGDDQRGWEQGQPQISAALAREYARLTPRAQYQQARTRRKTIIFGTAAVGLIAAFVLGALGMLGIFPDVFGSEFSKRIEYAEPGDTPCPTRGARPVSPDGVRLHILNSTSTPGLAGSVGAYFEELGYEIAGTDNAAPYRGTAEVGAGPLGVDAAYTVARYLGPDVRIVLNQTEDLTLTVLLGQAFEGTPGGEETTEIAESDFALVPLPNCLPIDPGTSQLEAGQSGQSGDEVQSDEESEDDGE